MVTDYKKIDLFGKTLIQKVAIKTPFQFDFPVSDYACFLFSLEGDIQFHVDEEQIDIPSNYSVLLNCLNTGKKITNSN